MKRTPLELTPERPGMKLQRPCACKKSDREKNNDFLHADFWPVFAIAILLFTLKGPIGSKIMVFQYSPGKSKGTWILESHKIIDS